MKKLLKDYKNEQKKLEKLKQKQIKNAKKGIHKPMGTPSSLNKAKISSLVVPSKTKSHSSAKIATTMSTQSAPKMLAARPFVQ